MSHLLDLVDEADKNKDGKIDFGEWEIMGTWLQVDLVFSNIVNSQGNQEENACNRKSSGKGRASLEL